ncbi:MAG: hypothetical protein AB1568_14375 [Thermodesulfobacteriota bacterium]
MSLFSGGMDVTKSGVRHPTKPPGRHAVARAVPDRFVTLFLAKTVRWPLRFPATLLLASLVASGCAAPSQTWYKQGGSQREFDTDARECEVIAKKQAREESTLGRDFSPEIFAEKYYRCLAGIGWSQAPAAGGTTSEPPPQQPLLGKLADNSLYAFDTTFPLPEGARLISTTPQSIGPTRIESWLFSLPDGTFVNLVLQKTDDAAFLNIDYPIQPPYQLYTSGATDNMRWSAFWGQNGQEWVQGIGAFAFLSRRQRCVIVVTAPLPGPAAPLPPGLSLAANQQERMGTFIDRWQSWLEGLAPQPGVIGRSLKAVGRAMSPY